MGKINVLGFDVANLIAAGEVVDRPASVVKELVENSIDAGADEITVEIKNGGISHIRVSDNGSGMDEEDLPVAVLRHATSKIKEAEDLSKIATLGFRGEALAAIASVVKLKIYSRTADAESGNMLICEGGEIVELCEAGCAKGTTVIADELFYNVPARRKFLKRDATETAKITEVMERVALSVPDISIKYISDGEIRFMTQGDGNLKNAVYSIFGKNTASRLIPVKRNENGVTVTGYVSDADMTFAKRSNEIFFVNGRFIKSPLLMTALERAYVSRIPEDKFPMCVLNLQITTSEVDVNVHPTKLEVKFSNERIVAEALHYAVLTSLNKSEERPEIMPGRSYAGIAQADVASGKVERIINAFAPIDKPKADREIQTKIEGAEVKNTVRGISSILAGYDLPKIDKTEKKENAKTDGAPRMSLVSDPSHKTREIPEYSIVGEAYDCYVIVELEDRLLIIDKHAAHERIIFDELCERRRNKVKESQSLLSPIKVRLSEEDLLSLSEYSEDVRSIGFDYTVSEDTVNITSVPSEIMTDAAESTFCAMLSRLSEGKGTVEETEAEFFEKALYQASCKAAIKGGRQYGIDHIRWICDRLLTPPDRDGKVIKTCPHGRPVAFEIKKSSIERQFLRLE